MRDESIIVTSQSVVPLSPGRALLPERTSTDPTMFGTRDRVTRAISLDQRRDESRNETAREVVSRNNGLAAAPGIRSVETPLDEHADVVALTHRCCPGM